MELLVQGLDAIFELVSGCLLASDEGDESCVVIGVETGEAGSHRGAVGDMGRCDWRVVSVVIGTKSGCGTGRAGTFLEFGGCM